MRTSSADEYADNYNLPEKSAGTDNHHGETQRYSGIQLTRPLQDVDDMIRVIKNQEIEIFTV